MEEKKKRSKLTITLVVIGVILIVGIVAGLSYAYWSYTASQKTVNKVTSDCIEVSITDETDAINLDKTYPISDAEAENLSPYTFKVTNTCNTAASYSINLEVMDVTDRLSSDYVAVSFNGGAKSILSTNTKVDTTYDEDDYTAIEAYNLGSGKLAGGKSESYTLKLWIDGSATNADSMKKTFISKITVTTGIAPKEALCKRATELHTDTCQQPKGTNEWVGCADAGYGEGSTLTYGNLGTAGTLTSGDAFDCDVNGDGTYDSATERFYYVSDYFDTETGEFDTSYATLIYYNNVSGGLPNNTTTYAWDVDDSSSGPVTAMLQLPTTSQWSNVNLKNTTRNIYIDNGSKLNSTSYQGYAARLLTDKEVDQAMNYTNWNFLFENTQYANPSLVMGYWTETIYYNDLGTPLAIDGNYGGINRYSYCTVDNEYGVRPAIDVAKTNMEY